MFLESGQRLYHQLLLPLTHCCEYRFFGYCLSAVLLAVYQWPRVLCCFWMEDTVWHRKKGILPVNFKPWPITLRVNFPYMIDEAMETIDQTADLTEHSSPQVALVTRLYVHTGGWNALIKTFCCGVRFCKYQLYVADLRSRLLVKPGTEESPSLDDSCILKVNLLLHAKKLESLKDNTIP